MLKNNALLEPAYLYADGSLANLKELAELVSDPTNRSRNAIVHEGDIEEILSYGIDRGLVKPVIDFPYGRGGAKAKELAAKRAAKVGLLGCDDVIDLWALEVGDFDSLKRGFTAVVGVFPKEGEVKIISQLPYVWQFARDKIEPLLDILAESGVKVIKDWTTVKNFSKKDLDTSDEARIAYTKFVRSIIDKKNLPLLIKIAGGVRDHNVVAFKKAGADMFGVGVPSAAGVLKSLEDAGYW